MRLFLPERQEETDPHPVILTRPKKNGENDRTAGQDGNDRRKRKDLRQYGRKNTVSGTSVKDREADTSEKDVKASEKPDSEKKTTDKRMAERESRCI